MSSKVKRVIGEEDPFTQLPEDILCDILSLLPSKEAARTCVLSKMWGHIFLHVQKLIVNCRDRNLKEKHDMLSFIERWITSSQEDVDEFRLISDYFPEESLFCSWLTTLLSRRIKVLELGSILGFKEQFQPGTSVLRRPLHPPVELYLSETLVHLKLWGRVLVLKIPGSIHYPRLKTLHLEDLSFAGETCHYRFTDACYPQLKEFCLDSVRFSELTSDEEGGKIKDVQHILTISLRTLEKLVVTYDWRAEVTERVDIDTQQLKHFEFRVERDTLEVNFSKCKSLVYAELYQFSSGESYIKLLSQINNVKKLKLSKQDYTGVAGSFPHFIHLTHLKLGLIGHQSLWFLLQHAPNLEVLEYGMAYLYEDYSPPEDVPRCLSQKLTEIRIGCYKWYEDLTLESHDGICNHQETVEYFLQHGAMLERLSLGHSRSKTAEWRQSTLNLLWNIARLSQKCEIDLQVDWYV